MFVEWIFLPILTLFGILLLLLLAVILIYNGLITVRNRVDNAWAQIDVQLKKRHDLVPNLVETVKGYAKHERTVFENVTKARAAMVSAGSIKEKAKADSMLTGALKSLFAVSESYPDLKANENFKMLQEQLDGIESKIAYARQFYNDNVLEYNMSLQKVPSNVVAGFFKFTAKEYFKVGEEKEREPVKVSFE
jgi:LemA protein